jgi:serine palmitoyltransferase
MLIGSVANDLNSLGGFCAGSRIVVDHQRINGTSQPRSRRPRSFRLRGHQHLPKHAFYPESATGGCAHDSCGARPYRLAHDPLARGFVNHPHPHTYRDAVVDRCGPEGPELRHRGFARCTVVRHAGEERLLQELVDEVLAQGVWITRARLLRGQELVETRPSIRLAVAAASALLGLSRLPSSRLPSPRCSRSGIE